MEIGPQKMKDALDIKKEFLMAFDESMLRNSRINRYRVLELSHILNDSFGKLVGDPEEDLSTELSAKIRNYSEEVYPLGLAFYAADVYYETSCSEDTKLERKELAKKVQEYDRELFKWAWALFENDPKLYKILIDIKKKSGHRDSADDVVKCLDILENNWDRVENNAPITTEYLDMASKDALKLINLLDKIEKVNTDEAKDLRKRAYSAWYVYYMEVRAAGRFILRGRKDLNLNKLFPNVSIARSKRSTKKPKPQLSNDLEIIE